MAIGADLLALAQSIRRPGRNPEQRRFESAARSALVLQTTPEEDLWLDAEAPKRPVVVRADAPLSDLAALPTYFRSPFDMMLGQAPQPQLLLDASPVEASEEFPLLQPLSSEANATEALRPTTATPLEATTRNASAEVLTSASSEDASSEDWALLRSWVELVRGLMRRRDAKAASNEATTRRALTLYLQVWRLDLWASTWNAAVRGDTSSSSSVVAATTSTVAMPPSSSSSSTLDSSKISATEAAATETAADEKDALTTTTTATSASGEAVAGAVSNLLGKSFDAGPGRLRNARRLVFGSAPRLMQKLLRFGGDEAGLATRRFVHVALMATLAAQCVPMRPPPHPSMHPLLDPAGPAATTPAAPRSNSNDTDSRTSDTRKSTGFRARIRRWIRPKSVARFYPRIGPRNEYVEPTELHAPSMSEASQHNAPFPATPGNSQGSTNETASSAALNLDEIISSSSSPLLPSTEEWLRIELLARRGLGLNDNRKAHPLRLSLVQTSTGPPYSRSALALVIVAPSRHAAVVAVRLAADPWALLTACDGAENGTVLGDSAGADITSATANWALDKALFAGQPGTVSEGARLVLEALDSPLAATTTVTVRGDNSDNGSVETTAEAKHRSGLGAVLRRASQQGDLKSVLFTGHGAGGSVATVAAAHYASLQEALPYGGVSSEATEQRAESPSVAPLISSQEDGQKERSRWRRLSVFGERNSKNDSGSDSTPQATSSEKKKKDEKKKKKKREASPYQSMLVTVGAPAVVDAALASLLEATVLPFGGLRLSSTGKRRSRLHVLSRSVRKFGHLVVLRNGIASSVAISNLCLPCALLKVSFVANSTGDFTHAMGSALGYATSGATAELPFLPLGNTTVAAPHLQASIGEVTYSFRTP